MCTSTPPHAPAPTPAELGVLRARMADAIDACVAVAIALAEEFRSPGTGRRLSGPLYSELGRFDLSLSDLATAFRESGNRWPAGAGEPYTVVYDSLVNGLYNAASRLVRSLSDNRRGDWTPEDEDAADAGDAATVRSVRHHAGFLQLVAERVREAGGEEWQFVELEREQKDWFDRFGACHGEGTGVICALRRGAAAPLLTGLSMKVIAGRVPSQCVDALPRISAAELERADRIIRQLVAIPDGMTTHWVGEEGSRRGVCRCYPDAPYAAPEQVERYLPRAEAAATPVPAAAPIVTGLAAQGVAEMARPSTAAVTALAVQGVAGEPGDGVTLLPVRNLDPVARAVGTNGKGKKINARMLEALQDQSDLVGGRSAQQWADALGCSKSSVIGTPTWKSLLGVQRVAKGLKNGPKKSRRR